MRFLFHLSCWRHWLTGFHRETAHETRAMTAREYLSLLMTFMCLTQQSRQQWTGRAGWKRKQKGSLVVTQPLLISLQVLGQSSSLSSGFTWPNLAPLLGLREPRSEQLFTSNILTPNHMRNRSGLGKSAFLSAHVLVSQRNGDIIRFTFLREELFSDPSLPTAARRPPVRSWCRPSAHPCGGRLNLLTEQQTPCDGWSVHQLRWKRAGD